MDGCVKEVMLPTEITAEDHVEMESKCQMKNAMTRTSTQMMDAHLHVKLHHALSVLVPPLPHQMSALLSS